MDSLAMPPATQYGWLPGNGEREGVRLLKETDSNMTTLGSSARRFCRDLFLPLDAHRSVMILLKKILSCPREFWVVDTTRLGCALGMERVRGLELWTLQPCSLPLNMVGYQERVRLLEFKHDNLSSLWKELLQGFHTSGYSQKREGALEERSFMPA